MVLVVFDPARITYEQMLALFWENHNPTQGMRQGNDRGTQYRSAIYWDTEPHHQLAQASRDAYNELLQAKRYPEITTEIAHAGPFYYAEDYHQQYLHKNPRGYDCHSGTGIACPTGLNMSSTAA
jgi:peptide-methionine (S)-S-oxide reductase